MVVYNFALEASWTCGYLTCEPQFYSCTVQGQCDGEVVGLAKVFR